MQLGFKPILTPWGDNSLPEPSYFDKKISILPEYYFQGSTEFPNRSFVDSDKSRGGCENCHKLQEEILQTLQQVLLARQERENECEKMANDWRQVAQVVDRLLFCVFLIATVGITLTLLIVIPWVRHSLESDEFDERLFGLSN